LNIKSINENTAIGLKKPKRKPKEFLQQKWQPPTKSIKERRLK
jgi:hypothetical protein